MLDHLVLLFWCNNQLALGLLLTVAQSVSLLTVAQFADILLANYILVQYTQDGQT